MKTTEKKAVHATPTAIRAHGAKLSGKETPPVNDDANLQSQRTIPPSPMAYTTQKRIASIAAALTCMSGKRTRSQNTAMASNVESGGFL